MFTFMKLILHILVLTIYCKTVQANQCYLTNNSSDLQGTTSNYIFNNKTLHCKNDYKNHYSLFNKKELKIIRAHKNELGSIKVLASSHGYHLISEKIDCKQHHCGHIDILTLDQFKTIKHYDKPNIHKKSINTTQQQAVNMIDKDRWMTSVVTLSSWDRKSGSTGNNSAMSWIEGQFNSLSLQTSTQIFTVSGNFTNNIIGIQPGSSTPDNWYVVGAHMDSIPSSGTAPGAVDNASGCAGVLEMARVASQFQFNNTIIFICYSGEEQGLIGSNFHVNSIINNGDQTKVKAALTMDMIGYTSNSQHELLLETSSANQWLMDILAQNAATYAPNLTVFMSTNPFGSDHMPYINNNMHGILSIDDDWNIYPAYHQSNDLPENLNLDQGEYILKTNMASLAELAEIQVDANVVFNNGFEN